MVATAGRGWRLTPSLIELIAQADALWPARSTASDGSIGDAAHSARTSDHNPDGSGDVLAVDLTDDKAYGCDADAFAELLVARRDPRVRYVICNGRIAKGYASGGIPAWTWQPYTGPNGHFQHTHVSIWDTDEAKNDRSPWFGAVEAEDEMLNEQQNEMLAAIHAAVIPDPARPPAQQHRLWNMSLWTLELAAAIRGANGKVDVKALAAALAPQLNKAQAKELAAELAARLAA